MRIKRLDLLRYGRFTDTRIVLRRGDVRLSRRVRAERGRQIDCAERNRKPVVRHSRQLDLQFPARLSSMRIGAVLENGGKTLDYRRRKGNKDTLLTADDVPTPGGPGALAPFLRAPTMLSSPGCSASITSASAAAAAKYSKLKTKSARCCSRPAPGSRDCVIVSRRLMRKPTACGLRVALGIESTIRRWNVSTGGQKLREHMVTAGRWQELKRAYDETQETYDVLEKQSEDISREQRKLSRIRVLSGCSENFFAR